MKIMDFMSFDLSWFKSLPGILLILGCFCLIIAIILIPTLTRKKDEFEIDLDPKEGEELLNKEEVKVTSNDDIKDQAINNVMVEEVKKEENIPLVEPKVEESQKIVIEPVVDMNNMNNTVEETIMPVLNNDNNNDNVLMMNNEKQENMLVIEEPKIEETKQEVINNTVVENTVSIPKVIPSIIEKAPEIKEEISVKKDSFGGEKLLPDDFRPEINQNKEAFGGEKLLPDDFKPEMEKPHLSNTQSFSLRDIAIQKEKQESSEVKEVTTVNQTVEKAKDDIEILEL